MCGWARDKAVSRWITDGETAYTWAQRSGLQMESGTYQRSKLQVGKMANFGPTYPQLASRFHQFVDNRARLN